MKITDIKVFPVRENKLKAFVSIILDDCFMVNDIKVIRGKEGLFISMPSRRKRNGKFKDIAHPLNNETRHAMEREILAAYEAGDFGEETSDEAAAQPPRERGRGRGRRRSRGRRGGARRQERPEEAVESSSSQRSEQAVEAPPQAKTVKPRKRPEPAAASQAEPESGKLDKAAASPEPPAPEPDHSKKSAEEVAEHHLSDSFWET